MLDSVTRKRIDNCRDILVGKLPSPSAQVEQITIALIYKFMDDMDRVTVEEYGGNPTFFKGDFAKYSWQNIYSPRTDAHQMLNLYAEGIQKMGQNPGLNPMFRSIFKDAFLPYRDPETLRLFLSTINEFSYEHSEMLGDAFEYLLSIMGSQGDAGQFRTPRHIIDFLVELVDPKIGETILDPACGTSGFLISAYKHILNSNKKDNPGDLLSSTQKKELLESINGYDISPDMVRLSSANLFLHGFTDDELNIYEYDTLSSEERWNEYYDVIIANPPFMTPKGGIRPHNRFSVDSNRAEVLFTNYIMEHLTPKGRAGIVVPEGMIFQSGKAYKQLRKVLVEKYLIGVISLPSGVFNPYSGVKTSILILDRELSQKTNKIFFSKIENDGFDLGAQRREIDKNDLPKVKKGVLEYFNSLKEGIDKEHPNLSYVTKEEIINSDDIGLSFERYARVEFKGSKFELVRLGDLVEVLDSKRRPISKNKRESGDYPYYGATGIVDYVIDYLFDEKLVLVGEDGAKWGKGERTSFIISGKTWVNNHAHVLRPKRDKILDELLVHTLNFLDLSGFITGVTVPKLNQKNLLEIQIPLPSLEIQKEIVEELEQYQKVIDGAKQVVDNYKPYIDIDPSWEMRELGDICEFKYGYTDTAKEKGDYRYIRITDIDENGLLKNGEEKYITKSKENESYLLSQGDLVVARTGATYGKCLYFENSIPSVYASYLIKLNLDNTKILNKYYWIFSQSNNYDEQKQKLVSGGAQPQFNANTMRRIIVPIPGLEEQKHLIETVNEQRTIIEGNKKLIEIYTQKIEDRINKIWGD